MGQDNARPTVNCVNGCVRSHDYHMTNIFTTTTTTTTMYDKHLMLLIINYMTFTLQIIHVQLIHSVY